MKERGMRVTRNKWWITLTQPIVGFDEGEGAGSGASSEGAGEGANGAGEGAGEGEGSQGTGTEGAGAGEDVSGLKSALEKERNDRKAMEKELKALRKAEETRTAAEKSEIERATDAATKESQKVAKLAAGFRTNAVNEAILKAAGAAKFRDPSDALRPEVLAAIGVEQDEDDPSDITIDEATVTAAIKSLAKSKPHYLLTDDGGKQKQQTPKSGSSFGGSAPQSNLTADEQALAKRYPALARRT
jgi:hypothetical protein